jgi:hypothetical protein
VWFYRTGSIPVSRTRKQASNRLSAFLFVRVCHPLWGGYPPHKGMPRELKVPHRRRIVASYRLRQLGSARSLLWAVSASEKQLSTVFLRLPISRTRNLCGRRRSRTRFRGRSLLSVLPKLWPRIRMPPLGGFCVPLAQNRHS